MIFSVRYYLIDMLKVKMTKLSIELLDYTRPLKIAKC